METKFKETEIGRIPEEWEVVSIRGINKARFDFVNPANSPQEIFEYYSIPAYLECGMPAIERGESILSNKLLVTSNTVLFGKLNPRVLKVWLVKPTTTYRQVASTEFLPILPNEKAVPRFIYYLCQSAFIAENSKQYAVGTTPSRQRVNPKAFYDMPFPLPPLPQQRKIADILSTVDETIEKTDAIIRETQQLKKGLMQKLFTEGIGHSRFKDTKIGLIPEEWEVKRIKDIANLGRGRVISQNDIAQNPGPYPVYSSQSKGEGSIGRLATYDFEGEYITWTTDGAYAGSVFYRNGRFNCTNVCGTVQLKVHDTDYQFLSYFLNRVAKTYVTYTGNPKLMNNEFAKILVAIPPLPEQRKIAEILSEVNTKIKTEHAFKSELEQLKKGLMQVLLTGKVRVKV